MRVTKNINMDCFIKTISMPLLINTFEYPARKEWKRKTADNKTKDCAAAIYCAPYTSSNKASPKMIKNGMIIAKYTTEKKIIRNNAYDIFNLNKLE